VQSYLYRRAPISGDGKYSVIRTIFFGSAWASALDKYSVGYFTPVFCAHTGDEDLLL
jgi:hypothetical protein